MIMLIFICYTWSGDAILIQNKMTLWLLTAAHFPLRDDGDDDEVEWGRPKFTFKKKNCGEKILNK